MRSVNYDIIIVGAGMVGCTLALALADSKLKIALVDASLINTEPPTQGFDPRVCAINRASQNIFQNLGVWQDILSHRACPYYKMQVWEGAGSIEFSAADIGQADLGHIIENSVIRACLINKLKALPAGQDVDFWPSCQLLRLFEQDNGVEIHTTEQLCLKTKLLLGADGARSWVCKQSNLDSFRSSYQQQAIFATVKTQQPHNQIARQRFSSSGPLALLPLSDPYTCSLVWSLDLAQAKSVLAMESSEFMQSLGHAAQHCLGRITQISQPANVPLYMHHLRSYLKPHIAIVGDAAHSLHPLAGQGVNLGLLDAACLVETLSNAIQQGRDFAALDLLKPYERWRKLENWLAISAMEGLKRLFGNQQPLLSFIRNVGLDLVDRSMPIKRKLVIIALGLGGDLPSMAKDLSE